jgi:flagellar protein FliS
MAFTRTNPYQQYRQTEVESIGQGKLIVMLYEAAIRFLNEAIRHSSDYRKYDIVNSRLLRVQDIISELMVSLNMDKGEEVAKNLLSIYIYLKNTLISANMEKSKSKMEEVLKHLETLKAAWAEVSDKEVAPPKNPSKPAEGHGKDDKGGISFKG